LAADVVYRIINPPSLTQYALFAVAYPGRFGECSVHAVIMPRLRRHHAT